MEALLSRAGTIGGVAVWSCPLFSDSTPSSSVSDTTTPHTRSHQRLLKMAAAPNPAHLSGIDSDNGSDGHSVLSVPLSAGASERRRAAARARRDRVRNRDGQRNRDAERDLRPTPKEIKLKTVPAHLQRTVELSGLRSRQS